MAEEEKQDVLQDQVNVNTKLKITGMLHFHLADGTVIDAPFEGNQIIEDKKED